MDEFGFKFGRHFRDRLRPRSLLAIISTVWIWVSGAATRLPRAVRSMAVARSARAAELTLTMSERSLISMVPSTVLPSSMVTFQANAFSPSVLGFDGREDAGSSSQFQNASFSRRKRGIAERRSASRSSVVWDAKGNRTS